MRMTLFFSFRLTYMGLFLFLGRAVFYTILGIVGGLYALYHILPDPPPDTPTTTTTTYSKPKPESKPYIESYDNYRVMDKSVLIKYNYQYRDYVNPPLLLKGEKYRFIIDYDSRMYHPERDAVDENNTCIIIAYGKYWRLPYWEYKSAFWDSTEVEAKQSSNR